MKRLGRNKKTLVTENLDIVAIVIATCIYCKKTVPGLSYEEIYQEGCYRLCVAATKFKKGDFRNYAFRSVQNGLYAYCRQMLTQHKKCQDNHEYLDRQLDMNEIAYNTELYDLLESLKMQHTGTILRGIHALQLRSVGYTGRDIADLYGVTPNQVSAWIAWASQKIKANSQAMKKFDKVA